MKFVFPNMRYKDKAAAFIDEFHAHESEINGSGSLDRFLARSTYEKWLDKVLADVDIANIPQGRVPAYTYFYVREEDDEIVGMINIRLALNDFLRSQGGHIGYCVRPTLRRRHFATQMLGDALKFCSIIGLNRVIITCDKSNIASAKVIQNCGGVLDASFFSEVFHTEIERYYIG